MKRRDRDRMQLIVAALSIASEATLGRIRLTEESKGADADAIVKACAEVGLTYPYRIRAAAMLAMKMVTEADRYLTQIEPDIRELVAEARATGVARC